MAIIVLPLCTVPRFAVRLLLPGRDLPWVVFRLWHRDLVWCFISADLAIFDVRSHRSRRGSFRCGRSHDCVPRLEVGRPLDEDVGFGFRRFGFHHWIFIQQIALCRAICGGPRRDPRRGLRFIFQIDLSIFLFHFHFIRAPPKTLMI